MNLFCDWPFSFLRWSGCCNARLDSAHRAAEIGPQAGAGRRQGTSLLSPRQQSSPARTRNMGLRPKMGTRELDELCALSLGLDGWRNALILTDFLPFRISGLLRCRSRNKVHQVHPVGRSSVNSRMPPQRHRGINTLPAGQATGNGLRLAIAWAIRGRSRGFVAYPGVGVRGLPSPLCPYCFL